MQRTHGPETPNTKLWLPRCRKDMGRRLQTSWFFIPQEKFFWSSGLFAFFVDMQSIGHSVFCAYMLVHWRLRDTTVWPENGQTFFHHTKNTWLLGTLRKEFFHSKWETLIPKKMFFYRHHLPAMVHADCASGGSDQSLGWQLCHKLQWWSCVWCFGVQGIPRRSFRIKRRWRCSCESSSPERSQNSSLGCWGWLRFVSPTFFWGKTWHPTSAGVVVGKLCFSCWHARLLAQNHATNCNTATLVCARPTVNR